MACSPCIKVSRRWVLCSQRITLRKETYNSSAALTARPLFYIFSTSGGGDCGHTGGATPCRPLSDSWRTSDPGARRTGSFAVFIYPVRSVLPRLTRPSSPISPVSKAYPSAFAPRSTLLLSHQLRPALVVQFTVEACNDTVPFFNRYESWPAIVGRAHNSCRKNRFLRPPPVHHSIPSSPNTYFPQSNA